MTPPEWPLHHQNAPFIKEEILMREVFLVIIAFVKQTATPNMYGNG